MSPNNAHSSPRSIDEHENQVKVHKSKDTEKVWNEYENIIKTKRCSNTSNHELVKGTTILGR